MKLFGEVRRRQAMLTAVYEHSEPVLDTLWHAQPVKISQKWRHWVELPRRKDQSCSGVEH